MDLTALTPDELRALINQADARLMQLSHDAQQTEDALRADITATIAALDALIGPDDAPPGTGSIAAVLGYDRQTMAQHAHVTLPLIVRGMDTLARTVRDLARVVGS